MKTAITVLQEMMMKLGVTPEYECISESGPNHLAMFEYRCRARGQEATAIARSKKEAKQEAARALLRQLGSTGAPVPPEFVAEGPQSAQGPSRSSVALLKELCEEYKLPAAEYELVGDTGPPHMRHFTIRATLGPHSRHATATTKKTARQSAADSLYHYLRENLKLTRDFVEEEALVRAHEKKMDRYLETRAEHAARPRLTQRLADYHLDEKTLALGAQALEETRGREPEVELGCATGALGLVATWEELPCEGRGSLHVVSLAPTTPPLAFAGADRAAAAAGAARYLRRVLPPHSAATVTATSAAADPVEPLDFLS